MKNQGYHTAPFQVIRWAAVLAVLCALTYLSYLFFMPGRPATFQLDWSRPLDWLMFGSPLALLAILAASAFLVRFFVLMHITAILAACSIPATYIQRNVNLDFLIIPLIIWVLMYAHAVAMRREKKRIEAAPEIPDAKEQGEIDSDACCVFCGYMLRGLRPDGRCPECGRPISRSLADEPLSLVRAQWYSRIKIGAILFAISLLLRMTVDFLFEHTRTFGWHPEYANYLYFVAVIFITVGAWFITASEKMSHHFRGTGARLAVRMVAVVYALLTWFFFIDTVLQQLAWHRKIPQSWVISMPLLSNRYDSLEEIVYVTVEWLLMFYVYLLATRMPSKGISRHAMIAGFLVMAFAGITIVAPMLYDFLNPLGSDILIEAIQLFLTDAQELYLCVFLVIFSVTLSRFYHRSMK